MATKGILAWDGGVLLYLILSASLFATEPGDCMSANAEAQQEGEWTIFGLTLAVVIVSFIIVGTEFLVIKQASGGMRSFYFVLYQTPYALTRT